VTQPDLIFCLYHLSGWQSKPGNYCFKMRVDILKRKAFSIWLMNLSEKEGDFVVDGAL
jgi:hypothetical protein